MQHIKEMMDLIKSTDSKYEEYENLLLERDQITKEAGQIWTVYLQLFGKLITDNYEEKLECIKCKKTIAYYQNALNHGGVVDSAAMEKYMEQEMAEYYYVPCSDENNEAFGLRGRYRKLTGICWNVDELYGSILVDNTRISLEDILRIGNADGIFQKDWTTDYPED